MIWAHGNINAEIARLLSLVESGAIEPNDPALKRRLVGLRVQNAGLDRDIVSLQETGQPTLTPEKLGVLSATIRKRLAEGLPEPRQAYMRLLLVFVTVDHQRVRLERSPAIRKRLAQCGAPDSCPEALVIVQGWRAGVVKRENWRANIGRSVDHR